MAPMNGLFGLEHHPDDNVGACDNNAGNKSTNDTQFSQPTNQFHSPLGNSYPPLQPPLLCVLWFYNHAPCNMTKSSQQRSGATEEYPSYGPSWDAYDFPLGGFCGPQMFPLQQFPAHGLSSPHAPQQLPAPPYNNPVIWLTSSVFTTPGQLRSVPGKSPISLPAKLF